MTIDNFSFAPLSRAYQQHQDKLILLVVVLLTLYLIAFLAELTWRLFDNSQEPNPVQSSKIVNTQNRQTSSTINIDSIKRLNLFGNAAAVAQVEVVEDEVTDAPETKLNLTLTGVVSSSDPTKGAAIVEKNNIQNTYGIGDKIEGTNATLDRIYVDRVIIKNRQIKETLMLDGVDFDEANKQNKQASSRSTTSNRQTVTAQSPRQSSSQRVAASRQVQAMRESVSQSPTSFADFISIRPHAPQGKLVGYRVSPGNNAEFFKQLGLRSGDIITLINGIDLSDMTQAGEAVSVLKEAQSLQLEIIRKGEPLSLDIEMPSSDEI